MPAGVAVNVPSAIYMFTEGSVNKAVTTGMRRGCREARAIGGGCVECVGKRVESAPGVHSALPARSAWSARSAVLQLRLRRSLSVCTGQAPKGSVMRHFSRVPKPSIETCGTAAAAAAA
eukprot:362189-Chlamydomonas_euryale.AAC.1